MHMMIFARMVSNMNNRIVLVLMLFLLSFNSAFAEKESLDPYIYPPEQTYLGEELEINPVKEMVIMQKKLGSMFDAMMREGYLKNYNSSPAMDFQETADSYIAKLDMPGMSKDAINVEIHEKVLTVSGDRLEGEEVSDFSGYYRKERSASSFKRVINLPGEVKTNQVNAKYENGVLTLVLPKLDPEQRSVKKIEVK